MSKKWVIRLVALIGLVIGAVSILTGQTGAGDVAPLDAKTYLNQNGRVPVGDAEGAGRGTIDAEALRQLKEIAGEYLEQQDIDLVEGLDPETISVDSVGIKVSQAVMDIEAIPVLDELGNQVGWFGPAFIELSDYDQRVAQAETFIADTTGTAYTRR